MKEFTQEQILRMFYIVGSITFLIVGIANTFTNAHFWHNMILSAKVSAVATNLFNYFIAIFFYSLLKGVKNLTPPPELDDKNLDEVFKELEE